MNAKRVRWVCAVLGMAAVVWFAADRWQGNGSEPKQATAASRWEPAQEATASTALTPTTESDKKVEPAVASNTTPQRSAESARIGDSIRYALQLDQRLVLGASERDETAMRVHGDAVLSLTRVGGAEHGWDYVGLLDDAQFRIEPRDAIDASHRELLDAALAAPFGFSTDAEGRVVEVRLAAESHPLARGLVRALLGSIQVVGNAGAAASWQAEETDSVGRYVAAYTRSAGGGLQKRKERYLDVTSSAAPPAEAGSQAPAVSVRSQAWSAELSDGALVTLTHSEQLQVSWGAQPVATAHWSLAMQMQRREVDLVGAAALAELVADWERVPLSGPEAAGTDERAHDEQEAGDELPGALLQRIQAAAVDPEAAEERTRAMVQLSARLRLTPDAAAEVGEWAAGGDRLAEESACAIGALDAAKTPEAATALLRIAADADAPIDARENAIAALASTTGHPGVVDELTALTRLEQPELADAALLALGTAAGQGESGAEATVLDALQGASTDDARVAALQAAGNVGGDAFTSAIEAALTDPSPVVRKAAVEGLRFSSDARADGWIASALLSDSSSAVRLGAVFALTFRAPTVSIPALSRGLTGDADPAVRGACLAALAPLANTHAHIVELLQSSATTDPEVAIREQASSYLAAIL